MQKTWQFAFFPLFTQLALRARALVDSALAASSTLSLVPGAAWPQPLTRRDLLAGRMPEQAAPVQRVTRPVRDQRPLLRRFTVKRVDFAY